VGSTRLIGFKFLDKRFADWELGELADWDLGEPTFTVTDIEIVNVALLAPKGESFPLHGPGFVTALALTLSQSSPFSFLFNLSCCSSQNATAIQSPMFLQHLGHSISPSTHGGGSPLMRDRDDCVPLRSCDNCVLLWSRDKCALLPCRDKCASRDACP